MIHVSGAQSGRDRFGNRYTGSGVGNCELFELKPSTGPIAYAFVVGDNDEDGFGVGHGQKCSHTTTNVERSSFSPQG